MRDEVLAEVVRGDLVESVHRGSFVLLDEGGEVRVSVGDVDAPMYPRSSIKPVQAAAMVRNGLELEPRLLALVAASHSGSPWHVAGVQEILAAYGCTAGDLRCIEGWPLNTADRDALVAEGGRADRLHFNCSGKHAGFIATSALNGWDIEGYLDPEHPLQQAVRELEELLTGATIEHVTVDGCGAPLFAIPLSGLARAFRAISIADVSTPEGRVAEAMRAYPEMVAGVGRDDTIAMQLMPGLIAKAGAEAVMAMALPDGRACAVKITDGSARGYQPLLRAVLRAWGLAEDAVLQMPVTSVLGGGRSMGRVRLSATAAAALA
jgi:L-asparaginase II